MMRRFSIFMLVVHAVAAPVAAQDDAERAQTLAQCLNEKSTEADEDSFRRMLVVAMQDAPRAEIEKAFNAFVLSAMQLAVGRCETNLSDLEKPYVGQAFQLHGEYIGRRVMQQALEKIQ